jgi:two-component system response regulator FixJ
MAITTSGSTRSAPSDTVLVVDDDPAVSQMLSHFLLGRGFGVRLAATGEAGLSAAAAEGFGLVLLDLRLPGMDGLECLRRLRAQGFHAPVVMMTGYGDIQTAVEAMKAGAADFLEKPFRLDALASIIEAALSRRTQPAEYDDPVVAYVQRYATEVNSRREVAGRLGISQEQVSKRIQGVTGHTFRRFLHLCRLETAKRLLTVSDLPVAQVASRTGFQTVQHFSRVFRSYAGVPPRAYRLKSRVVPEGSATP